MKPHIFKEGEWAWSPREGWAKIQDSPQIMYPLKHGHCTYTNCGKALFDNRYRSLLTVEEAKLLGIEGPPKQKVTKTLEMWANVYPDGELSTWKTKYDADFYAMNRTRIACVRLTGCYEVEE